MLYLYSNRSFRGAHLYCSLVTVSLAAPSFHEKKMSCKRKHENEHDEGEKINNPGPKSSAIRSATVCRNRPLVGLKCQDLKERARIVTSALEDHLPFSVIVGLIGDYDAPISKFPNLASNYDLILCLCFFSSASRRIGPERVRTSCGASITE